MAKTTILIIEDEADIIELLRFNLSSSTIDVQSATNGEDGLKLAKKVTPDLIILDVMLPGKLGTEVCREIRQDKAIQRTPILMLTAKTSEEDIINGLNYGADDYLTKPFNLNVLKARVNALIRRASQADNQSTEIHYENLRLNTDSHQVFLGDEELKLTPAEFEALKLFMSKPGWAFSRQKIVENTHGTDHFVTDRTVDVLIVNLRKKLLELSDHIETVRSVGYRLRGTL